MRCICCNVALSDYESSIKSKVSGDYLDMCTKCLSGLGIEYTGNQELNRSHSEYDDDWDTTWTELHNEGDSEEEDE